MSDSKTEVYKAFTLKLEDGIAYFTINRPEARNALNLDCFDDLNRFLDFIAESDEVKIAILTGAGEKAFIAGADINNVRTKTGVQHLRKPSLEPILRRIETCDIPIIAAVNGYAFGGGFELALACDIRIASENAQFGLPETSLGIYPGAGGTQRLPRIAGIGVAKEVILAGRILKAEEAKTLGIVMAVVPLDQLLAQATDVAKRMMAKGPVALTLAKKVIAASADTDITTGAFIEALGYCILLNTKDKTEGTDAFLEKRPPAFTGE
ncbi:3-hydroxybutyryl-CoA dehydratase [Clostridia bacterium]|nr:3-hydroxybutyryl-CoA dehydratase [Clostridia bacterium]